MRYQVPQFIEIEDKVFGPFTIRQFVFIAGGAGITYITFILFKDLLSLPFIIAAIPAVVVAVFSGLLAYYKPNGKPFIAMVEAAFKYFFSNKLYIWKRKEKLPVASDISSTSVVDSLMVPKISDSKLRDLSWSLDVKDGGGDKGAR